MFWTRKATQQKPLDVGAIATLPRDAFHRLVARKLEVIGWSVYPTSEPGLFQLGSLTMRPVRVYVRCFEGVEASDRRVLEWCAAALAYHHPLTPKNSTAIGVMAVAQGFFSDEAANALASHGITVWDARDLAEA